MKHNFEVEIIHTGTIELNPELDWEQIRQEFNEFIFKTNDMNEFLEFIAQQIAKYGSGFIEGVGVVRHNYTIQEGKWEDWEGAAVSVKFDLEQDINNTEVTPE